MFTKCKTFSERLNEEYSNKLNKCPEDVILITSSQRFYEFNPNWKIID
jgi:hypothetical protein